MEPRLWNDDMRGVLVAALILLIPVCAQLLAAYLRRQIRRLEAKTEDARNTAAAAQAASESIERIEPRDRADRVGH